MIEIVDINALASVQDLGRENWRHIGVGSSGAMDGLALRAGNLLLNNEENAAAVEISLGSMTLVFRCDTTFCITGAMYKAQLDGVPVHSYWRYPIKRGQTLQLLRAVYGMYGYVCVAGGIVAEEILGSRSSDISAQLGLFNGRYLQAGDVLPIDKAPQFQTLGIAPIATTSTIHALISSEYEAFSRQAQFRLWQNRWTLQSNSNRMGYRLSGESLTLKQPLEMLSHAVQAGTVQVPPSGFPIILMANAQTTGGYPKIACVAAADLGRLAQIRLGAKFKLQVVTASEAAKLWRKNEIYINQIRNLTSHAAH